MPYMNVPGHIHRNGKRFKCPCGSDEFKVEIGTDPTRFWCECGAMYTEYLADALAEEWEKGAVDGV